MTMKIGILNDLLKRFVCALTLIFFAARTFAQTDDWVENFNTPNSTQTWVLWWGLNVQMAWDSTHDVDAAPDSGSFGIQIPFTGAADDQMMIFCNFGNRRTWDESTILDGTKFTNLVLHIRVDPESSLATTGDFGSTWECGFVHGSWGTISLGSFLLPPTALNNWVTVRVPIIASSPGITTLVGIYVANRSRGSHTNTMILNIDRMTLESKTRTLPSITANPVGASVKLGETAKLDVTASGSSPRFFQWRKNGIPIDGATGTSLTFTNVQPPQIGDYSVVVSNYVGSITSSVATLHIDSLNPAIWEGLVAYYTFNSKFQDISGGGFGMTNLASEFSTDRFGRASFALTQVTSNGVVVQSQQKFPLLGNATRTISFWSKLASTNISSSIGVGWGGAGAAGNACQVSIFGNGVVNLWGNFADLNSIEPLNFDVTRWHHVVVIYQGNLSTCRVFVDGVAKMTALGNQNIRDDLDTVATPIMVAGWGFTYTQFGGSIDDIRIYNRELSTQEVEQLYISESVPPAAIVTQPKGSIVSAGSSFTFSVVATDPEMLTYQWKRNGIDIPGATNSSLKLQFVEGSDRGDYTVELFHYQGSIMSTSARLEVIQRATASPVLAFGFVVGGTISGGGYGYTNTPLVRIVGGGGSGAVAVAVVSNGVVTGINMLNAGFGYTGTPQMIIQPPFIPTPGLAVSPMTELTSSDLAPGGNYQLQRKMVWFWTNEMPGFQSTSSTITQLVAGIAGTATYRLVLSPTPSQAFATPQMVNGFVVGVAINAGGSGYVTTPRVVIYGGGGTNATAVASLTGGVVTGIAITSAGIGYTSAPSIRIDPPPAASVIPTQTSVLRLKSANLSPYDSYRFEGTPGIGVGWTAIGSVVVPTESTNTTDLTVTNSAGFLRLKYAP